MSEENPTQTKYIYSVNIKDVETLRLSEFATREELVQDLLTSDKDKTKSTICWLAICILAFIVYKIIERKKKVEN